MGNNGHDGGELKSAFMPGLSYVHCSEFGRRGFSVWNQATAEGWFKKHTRECSSRETSSARKDKKNIL